MSLFVPFFYNLSFWRKRVAKLFTIYDLSTSSVVVMHTPLAFFVCLFDTFSISSAALHSALLHTFYTITTRINLENSAVIVSLSFKVLLGLSLFPYLFFCH